MIGQGDRDAVSGFGSMIAPYLSIRIFQKQTRLGSVPEGLLPKLNSCLAFFFIIAKSRGYLVGATGRSPLRPAQYDLGNRPLTYDLSVT
ncbi:MAG: hypothetical protein A2V67_06735 [Deltaproteobacteria bacterium RBG_13_61_14]|nr:MAG: hypothetical protein A2V67_06735 [Deltaproteobacteria bacterium RBG_13_61_14]